MANVYELGPKLDYNHIVYSEIFENSFIITCLRVFLALCFGSSWTNSKQTYKMHEIVFYFISVIC